MTKFAKLIFQKTEHGLAKQILHIAICECEIKDDAYRYFQFYANFELSIKLTSKFTLENARNYFDCLVSKIETEELY